MAKSGTTRSGKTSRIRFIMLDAELAEGDLTQVTEAIQNALRPYPAIQSRITTGPALNGSIQGPPIDDAQPMIDEQEIVEAAERSAPNKPRLERTSRVRRYSSPEVIEVDLLNSPAFADYITDKEIDSDADRFLTVAAWFKECRQINEITVNHVYTCYRAAHWPTNLEDFTRPFRHLKSRKLMNSTSRGIFTINHLGLAQVKSLSSD